MYLVDALLQRRQAFLERVQLREDGVEERLGCGHNAPLERLLVQRLCMEDPSGPSRPGMVRRAGR